jgi:hypothetical protein
MRIGREGEAACASHIGPVVSENRATDEADLVVLAMQAAMGPGEPVRAQFGKHTLEELGHAGLAPSHCETHKRAARTVARTGPRGLPGWRSIHTNTEGFKQVARKSA